MQIKSFPSLRSSKVELLMETRGYPLKESPLYRLRSKKKLAELLFTSTARLQALAKQEGTYVTFSKRKRDGTLRPISAPIPPLKSIQSRLADLLSRVETPNYLFAPVKGRSYVDNAAAHKGQNAISLLDIENLFPNCTINKAIWFFQEKLECSTDVSVILARIVTHQGSLPQGSPCSPILAYFSYQDMWDEIEYEVNEAGCRLSVYADDLTISGRIVPKEMIFKVKRILRRHGHSHSERKERAKIGRPVEITGVIVKDQSLSVPNRQRKKIIDVQAEISGSKGNRETLKRSLRGRLAQIKQVEDH